MRESIKILRVAIETGKSFMIGCKISIGINANYIVHPSVYGFPGGRIGKSIIIVSMTL